MKKVIVTGAQGFVGSRVVAELEQLGCEVIPVVRKSDGTYPNAIEWDIAQSYDGPLIQADAVVHVAAKVSDWAPYDETFPVNVTGTENVVAAFASAKLFVYISSASVYDPLNTTQVITEESPAGTHLLNAYSQTKFEGEQVVLGSSIASRVVLRPHIIYGPGDKSVLPRLLQARRAGRFLILGDGTNYISLTHITNLTHAVRKVIEHEALFPGEVFNIADRKSDTVRNIVGALKKELSISEKNLYIPKGAALALGIVLENVYRLMRRREAPLITPYIVEQMTSDHVIDCTKAERVFGYDPTVEYSVGFTDL